MIEKAIQLSRLSTAFFAAALLFLPFGGAAEAFELRIGSWNIERLGHGRNKDFKALAVIIDRFDFVAVQEAMNRRGIERLKAEVERQSGESWSTLYSHRIGERGYYEKYLFLWRDSQVEFVDGAAVYILERDRFMREPFSARFLDLNSQKHFVVANLHLRYGRNLSERVAEVEALYNYWNFLTSNYEGEILMMGDFNLAPSHPAWNRLKSRARPLIVEGATTVSSREGRYANLYDNIWIDRHSTLSIATSGILPVPQLLGITHVEMRRHISDHVPVYLALGSRRVDRSPMSDFTLTLSDAVLEAEELAAEVAPDGGEIRGNRRSQVYHRPDCPGYSQMAPRNIVPFADVESAEEAGFRLAGNCPELR